MTAQNSGMSEQLHPSVKRLLADHPGETDPEHLIRKLARNRVAYAKEHGWSGPPFCPVIFASIFNVVCNEVDHDIGGDGRILLSRAGRPIIEYKSGYLAERQRFTMFHEFAHLLFRDYCEFVPHHHTFDDSESPEHRYFEYLCDVGASEMIMPMNDFESDLKRYSRMDVASIQSLGKRYEASVDAAISRCAELGHHVAFSAAFLTDQKGKHDGPGPLWVKYSKKTTSFKGFIWPGTCPPSGSVVLSCFENGLTSEPRQETWTIKERRKSFLVQALKLPEVPTQPSYPKIAALFS